MAGALLWWFVTFWNTPPTSLGEASFREMVRRHHTSASTRVVNDATLGPAPVGAVVPPETLPVIADDTAKDDVKDATEVKKEAKDVKNEAWWQARMAAARESVSRDRLLVAALDARVAALASDIAGRDDPQQRALLMTAREDALKELARLKRQVDDGVAAIAAIVDEARKAGVPPGWVR